MTSPTPDHWSCEVGPTKAGWYNCATVRIPHFHDGMIEDGWHSAAPMPMMEFKELDRNKRYEVWLMAVKPELLSS